MNGDITAGLRAIAESLQRRGNADAATPQGALEAQGGAVLEAAEKIATALHDVADVIREHGTSDAVLSDDSALF